MCLVVHILDDNTLLNITSGKLLQSCLYFTDEKSGSPACAYSLLDFEDEEEFLAFFIKYRLCIVEVVRQATRENSFIFSHSKK